MYRDRLFRGFIAGVAGGVAMNIFSLLAITMNWTELPFWMWAAILVLGREQIGGAPETILGVIAHLMFTGFLGIIFSFLVPYIKSRGILVKGLLFSIATWFSIYGVTHLFNVQGTSPIELRTAVSNLTGAVVYGIVTAWALTYLYKKAGLS